MTQVKIHNIEALLKKRTDVHIYNLIKTIGCCADGYNVRAYLVGGIVRDVFLDTKDVDIDITVEGNGMEFAKYLADKLGAAYKGFDRFKTGKVFIKDGMRIDVASARAELYPKPASLPEVEFTEFKLDLFRRDFTINSMAMKINRDGFGEFIDPFDGIGDLKRGILRCLHEKSFIDDPTRIIRAVRFETRYGYKIEKRTMSLLKQALKLEAFKPAPGERLRDEIIVLLEEKDPYKAIKRLETIGALEQICPGVKIGMRVKHIFKRLRGMDKYGDRMPLLYMMAILRGLSGRSLQNVYERMKFSNEWMKLITQSRSAVTKIKYISNKKITDGGIYSIMTGLNPEVMFYMTALTDNKNVIRNVKRYMDKLMHTDIEIDGNDLIKLGIAEGPAYAGILKKVKMAKLDGKVKNRAQEIELAREIILNLR
jgi:tRNA nucleotidyltransferase (CCA-adding enzyme)